MTIEVANESGVGVDEPALVSIARYVLDHLGINPLAELSILLMDVPAMTELHVKWMDEPGPTDVMSFPMDELDTARRPDEAGPGPTLLGDVVLCPDVAAEQAAGAGHSLDDELHLLTVHGVLHLLGYDHAEPAAERDMFRLQNDLLDAWREQRDLAAHRSRIRAVDSAVLDTVGLAQDNMDRPAWRRGPRSEVEPDSRGDSGPVSGSDSRGDSEPASRAGSGPGDLSAIPGRTSDPGTARAE